MSSHIIRCRASAVIAEVKLQLMVLADHTCLHVCLTHSHAYNAVHTVCLNTQAITCILHV